MNSLDFADRDAAWLARLRANDESALREIMELYFDHVAALAFRYVRSRDVAADIAQDTFIRVWDQRRHLSSDTTIRAYVSRVARNRAVDLLRHDARTTDVGRRVTAEYVTSGGLLSENAGIAKVDCDEFHALVHSVADTLTPRVREVLLLYFEEQLEPKEIADVLGIAPKTVYAQLRTALQTYAKALVGRWP